MKTTTVGAEQLRRELTDLLNRAGYGGERFIVERHGTPLVAVIPYEEYMRRPVTFSTKSLNGDNMRERSLEHILDSLSQSLEEGGVTYEMLAEGMKRERIRTLKEHYPEFWEMYGQQIEESIYMAEEPADEPVAETIH